MPPRIALQLKRQLAAATVVVGAFSVVIHAAGPATDSPAAAQPPVKSDTSAPAQPATFESLIADLHADRFQTREDATAALLGLPAEKRSDIEVALAQESDPEAVLRLTHVAVHLMLKGQTPLEGKTGMLGIALGIEPIQLRPDDEDAHSAIVVTEVKPGFPAAELLKAEDRIIAVDGQYFPEQYEVADFQGLVKGRVPGSALRLTVLRNGKRLELAVRIAGLSLPEDVTIIDFIHQREEATRIYLRSLKTDMADAALVVRDNSPRHAGAGPIQGDPDRELRKDDTLIIEGGR